MTAKPVVFHVVPSLSFGGAQLGVIELARELAIRGSFDVRLCILGPDDGAELPVELASKTTFLGMRDPTASILTLVGCVAQLQHIMKAHGAKIAHSHLLPADLVTAFASAWRGRVLHIAHIRDTRPWITSPRIQDRVRVKVHQAAYSCAKTCFVAVSTSSARHACSGFSIDKKHMAIVLNGVALERLKGDDPPPTLPGFHIGCAGRLVPEKGFATVVEAASLLCQAGLDVVVTIAGSGSLESALLHRADELGLTHRVKIIGNIEDMGRFYRGLDLLVVPSLATEGLPRVMLEAMAVGCPVIATTTAGAEDVISHRRTGLLVPPSDAAQLANAILSLKDDHLLRRRLADSGQMIVRDHFTVDRVAAEIEELYRRLLDRNPRRESRVKFPRILANR